MKTHHGLSGGNGGVPQTSHKGFKDRKIFSTLDGIIHNSKRQGWSKSLTKKYNRLDKEVTNSMLKAEHKVHPHHRTHPLELSTSFKQATRAMRYWNVRISQYKKQKGNQDIINKEKSEGKVDNISTTLLQQLKNERRISKKN